jgi:hypothetical protein
VNSSQQRNIFVFGMSVDDYIEAAFSQLAYVEGVYVAPKRPSIIRSIEKKLLGFSRHYLSPSDIETSPDIIGKSICSFESSTLEHASGVTVPDIILIFESPMGIAQSFVGSLRKRYPTAKIVLYLVNALAEYPELVTWISQASVFCDGVITCNKRDAEVQGWHYYPDCYTQSPTVGDVSEATNDFCFLARDKHRSTMTSEVATKLTSLGFTGRYLIVSDNTTIESPSIEYLDHYLPYDEYLSILSESRGIVEIVANGENYSTLRTMEAVVYGRALVTNNRGLIDENYYDKNRMLIINSADDLTRDKIESLLQNASAGNSARQHNPFSPEGLLRYVKSL